MGLVFVNSGASEMILKEEKVIWMTNIIGYVWFAKGGLNEDPEAGDLGIFSLKRRLREG